MTQKPTSKDISRELRAYFNNYDYHLENTYVFSWESDFFCASRDRGYMYEVEIKISRGDFKADFKKDKHELMLVSKKNIITQKNNFQEFKQIDGKRVQLYSGIDYIRPANELPNYFYYACPAGVIKPEEVPAYAGLLIYSPKYPNLTLAKKAPFLHKQNNMIRKRAILFDKFYYLALTRQKENRHLQDFKRTHDPELKYLRSLLQSNGINPNNPHKEVPTSEYGRDFIKLVEFIYKQVGQKCPDPSVLFHKFHGKVPDPSDRQIFFRPKK